MEPIEEQFYFPPSANEYAPWAKNLYTRLLPYQGVLGISDTEMNRLNKIQLGLNYNEECNKRYGAFANDCKKDRDLIAFGDKKNSLLTAIPYRKPPTAPTVPEEAVGPDENTWVVKFVGRLRKNDEMNINLSKELGIDSRPGSTHNDKPPVLKGKIVNGKAVLNCPLLNLKGYEVWRKDSPTGELKRIGISLSRTYTDDSELPDGVDAARRTYVVRMIGKDNEPVGLPSNEVTLTVYRSQVPG